MVDIQYALQTCDTNSWQGNDRYAGTKPEIVRKCVTSFFKSVAYAARQRPESNHVITVIDDDSTQDTVDYIKRCGDTLLEPNMGFIYGPLKKPGGVMESIKECYRTLDMADQDDLVYQVQDDYLYTETAIFEMIDVFMQLRNDVQTDAVVASFHDHRYWKTIYRYKVTPRMIFPAAYQNWMQIYDIPCTFLTSKRQFTKHWDLYYKFFDLIGKPELEAGSLNKMFTERGVLGVQPFNSVALHMQDEVWKDPFLNWKKRWEKVELI